MFFGQVVRLSKATRWHYRPACRNCAERELLWYLRLNWIKIRVLTGVVIRLKKPFNLQRRKCDLSQATRWRYRSSVPQVWWNGRVFVNMTYSTICIIMMRYFGTGITVIPWDVTEWPCSWTLRVETSHILTYLFIIEVSKIVWINRYNT